MPVSQSKIIIIFDQKTLSRDSANIKHLHQQMVDNVLLLCVESFTMIEESLSQESPDQLSSSCNLTSTVQVNKNHAISFPQEQFLP